MCSLKKIFPSLLAVGLFFTASFLDASDSAVQANRKMVPPAGLPWLEEIEELGLPGENLAMALPEETKRPAPEHSELRAKHEKRIGLFRLWRIMNEVDLSDEQVDKFFPLMRKIQKKERELSAERRSLLKGLHEELKKEKPDKEELQRLIAGIKENGRQMWQAKEEAIEKASEILTVEQQARLILAMNRVEKDIWEAIARVRGRLHEVPGFKFDRDKLPMELRNLRKRLEQMTKELKEKGLLELDTDLDFNNDEKDSLR